MPDNTANELALRNWRALPHHPVPRAALIAGVSTSQIFNLIRRGSLRARRLGSRTMVDTASLSRLFEDAPLRQPQGITEPGNA